MENLYRILERQCTCIEFKDGKVEYFSLSTQHSTADTIDEAIERIIDLDKKYDGQSAVGYVLNKYENTMSDKIMENKTGMNVCLTNFGAEKLSELWADSIRKTFGYA